MREGPRRRRVEVIGLYAQEHEIHGADRRGIVGGRHGTGEIADDAGLDREAARPEGIQVGPPRDERHILAGPGQQTAEEAAHPAAPHHCDPHDAPPSSPRPSSGPVADDV
jgi:hypothetical protein